MQLDGNKVTNYEKKSKRVTETSMEAVINEKL